MKLAGNALNFSQLYQKLGQKGGKFTFNTSLTIGFIITRILPYIFTIAGILLLIYLLFGGFQIMFSQGEPKNIEAGKEKITKALLGFAVVFASFWIVQIVARILGLTSIITILG